MKKKYIKPMMGKKCMDSLSLLTASLNHVDSDEAATGSESNTVNFGRSNGGSFWDDTE